MKSKILQFIFFGNYFIGLLAVALSLETVMQNRLPYNNFIFYLLLFTAPILYYTYAYTNSSSNPGNNPRNQWYHNHRILVKRTQILLSALCSLLILSTVFHYYRTILELPVGYWLSIGIIMLVAVSYYGLIPKAGSKASLRNTGWLKSFVIGFMWASCTSLLPVMMLRIETGIEYHDPALLAWFFIKNWMFCTVNAILFDIKDYPSDANKHLKTVVVRLGLRRTIFYFLIPLLLIGMFCLFIFATIRGFGPITMACNLLPFLLTLFVVYSMRKRKNILYYLIVIDGLVFFKAICGMVGMLFVRQ